MEIKGYVWGGSLHGQVTVQDSFEFVCRRIADLPLARFPEPYPRWKRFICRLIGVPQSDPIPDVQVFEEVYEAKWWIFGNRRMCIFQLRGIPEPTDKDRMHIFRTHPDLVEIMESPFDLTGSHYLFNRHIQRG